MNVTPIYIYKAHAQIIEIELRRFNLFHLQRFDAADISDPVLFLACGVPNDDMDDSTCVVVVTLGEPVLWDVGVVCDVDITTCVAVAVGDVEITACVAVEDVNGRSVVRSSHFGSPTSHGSCADPWL